MTSARPTDGVLAGGISMWDHLAQRQAVGADPDLTLGRSCRRSFYGNATTMLPGMFSRGGRRYPRPCPRMNQQTPAVQIERIAGHRSGDRPATANREKRAACLQFMDIARGRQRNPAGSPPGAKTSAAATGRPRSMGRPLSPPNTCPSRFSDRRPGQ